ncbi:MAG: hypothetical protein LBI15_02830 [Dysgonamonadaceae bacterium]|jgi:hypothetical protein|nr:hypothetical protein [Dysgonamonadaceae bacterium]
MKVSSLEEWEKEKNRHKSVIEQAKREMDKIDDKWEYLSEKEKYSDKGMKLLQEQGDCMNRISKSRKELSELKIDKAEKESDELEK